MTDHQADVVNYHLVIQVHVGNLYLLQTWLQQYVRCNLPNNFAFYSCKVTQFEREKLDTTFCMI